MTVSRASLFLLAVSGCHDLALGPAEISEGAAVAMRHAILALGAAPAGVVNVHIEDSVAARLDPALIEDALDPWAVQFVQHSSIEAWVRNGASDCTCTAVVYLASPPEVQGRVLTEEVVVVVPVGRVALYEVSLFWQAGDWSLRLIEVVRQN